MPKDRKGSLRTYTSTPSTPAVLGSLSFLLSLSMKDTTLALSTK